MSAVDEPNLSPARRNIRILDDIADLQSVFTAGRIRRLFKIILKPFIFKKTFTFV